MGTTLPMQPPGTTHVQVFRDFGDRYRDSTGAPWGVRGETEVWVPPVEPVEDGVDAARRAMRNADARIGSASSARSRTARRST
jgi:hypothetical protein